MSAEPRPLLEICRDLARVDPHDHEYGRCIFCGEQLKWPKPQERPHAEGCPWQAMLDTLK